LVDDKAFAEGSEHAALSIGDPSGQRGWIAVAHHSMEALDQVTSRHQCRNTSLDARDGDRVALRQVSALAQQQ
jgi:hypothetical protein